MSSVQVFPGKVLGLSWRADTVTRAGICGTRTNLGTQARQRLTKLSI